MENQTRSLSEVAGLMGVSERTVRRWIKAGRLKAYKPGRDYRIPEAGFRAFIEESEISPKAVAPPSSDKPAEGERRYNPEDAVELEERFMQLTADFKAALDICRRVMARADFDEDLALVTRAASERWYDFANRYFNVVDNLNAVEDAVSGGEDVPQGLQIAAANLRTVLFGPRGLQGVGAAVVDRVRLDSPITRLFARAQGAPGHTRKAKEA